MNTVMLKAKGPRTTIEAPCTDSSEAMSKLIEFRNNGIRVEQYEIVPILKPVHPDTVKTEQVAQ